MANDYRKQAEAQYDPSYNARVQAMKNQLAQNQLALDQSKTGINANYDTQVGNQNRNNMISKNNISNTMLGRGLGNSSIVTSGLAESDARNTRMVGDINNARTGALNDIEAQKQMLAQNMNNTLAQLQGDREKELMALANQLEDRQFEKDFKNKQFALQQQQAQAEMAYKNSMLAMEREKFNAQKLAQQGDPDEMRATLQAIHLDPSRTTSEKYAMMKTMLTRYGNKAGFGEFKKEAEGMVNTYGMGINSNSALKSSLSNGWSSSFLGDSSSKSSSSSKNIYDDKKYLRRF